MKKRLLLALIVCCTLVTFCFANNKNIVLAQTENSNLETPSNWAKEAIDEASAVGIIPNTDQFKGLYTSNMTKYDFLKLIVHSIENDYNNTMTEFVKSKGLKYEYYSEGSISFIGNIDGKEDVYPDWTQEHKEEIQYIIDTKYTWKTDAPFKDISDVDMYHLYSLGLIDTNTEGLFNGDAYLTREEIAVLLYKLAEIYDDNITVNEQMYSDTDAINPLNKKAVDFVISNNIMLLKEGNQFAPKEYFTFEEGYIAILNFANIYMSNIFVDNGLKVVVEPMYDSIEAFSDGLALVSKDNKYFYINKSFEKVIEFDYEGYVQYNSFLNNRAIIHTEDYYIVIDTAGNEVARFESNKYDLGSKFIYNSGFLLAQYFPNADLYYDLYYIDVNGKKYDYSNIGNMVNGLAIVMKRVDYKKKYGIIDESRVEIVPCIYDDIQITENLVSAKRQVGENQPTDLYTIYDRKGNVLLEEAVYSSMEILDNGCISLSNYKTKVKNIIGVNGELLYDSTKYSLLNYKDGYFKIADNNNSSKIIDSYGNAMNNLGSGDITILGQGYFYNTQSKKVLDATGKEILNNVEQIGEFGDNIINVKVNKKWRLYDTSFNETVTINENIGYFWGFKNGVSVILDTNYKKQGVINTKGDIIIPFTDEFVVANQYDYGIGIVMKGDKYGCCDINGNMILDIKYDEIKLTQGLILVKLNDLYGVYNDEGEELLDVSYTKAGLHYNKPFAEARGEDGELFFIDKNGNRYDKVTQVLETDMFRVGQPNGNQYLSTSYGLMNMDGDLLSEIKYYTIIFSGPYIHAYNDDCDSYYDLDGKEVISSEYTLGKQISEELFIAYNGHSYGAVNTQGEIVIPFDYESLSIASENLLAFKLNGKYGFIERP